MIFGGIILIIYKQIIAYFNSKNKDAHHKFWPIKKPLKSKEFVILRTQGAKAYDLTMTFRYPQLFAEWLLFETEKEFR